MAQITAKWPGSLSVVQEFEEKFTKEGFPMDISILLKNLIVFTTNQSRYRGLNKISAAKIQKGWDDAKIGMEFAVNFLRSNVNIESPSLLSSNWLAVVVAVYGKCYNYELNSLQASQLRRWGLIANAKGRFSRGSSESLLNEDLSALKNSPDVSSLLQLLERQIGRLKFVHSDLVGANSQSAYFKSMFLAFQSDGAVDWNTSLQISLKHSGNKHQLQFHHIFPRVELNRKGIERRKVNDICNLAFIGGQTNRRLGKKMPADYFANIIEKLGKQALESQCIPTEPSLWKLENYDDFLQSRRELIAERLNKLTND